jgi:hypothetical protein
LSELTPAFSLCIHLISDPRLKQLSEQKMDEWRAWFDNRLDNAIEAVEVEHKENGQSTIIIYFLAFKNDCNSILIHYSFKTNIEKQSSR